MLFSYTYIYTYIYAVFIYIHIYIHVCCFSQTVSQQLAIFAYAAAVVGPHGGGFSNIGMYSCMYVCMYVYMYVCCGSCRAAR